MALNLSTVGGHIAQWLRVLLVLPENPNSGPSTHISQLSSLQLQGSDIPFGSPWALAHMWHIHTHNIENIYI